MFLKWVLSLQYNRYYGFHFPVVYLINGFPSLQLPLCKLHFFVGIFCDTSSYILFWQLYKNGLQRDLFLPCIETIKRNCEIHAFNTTCIDYRLISSPPDSKRLVICADYSSGTDVPLLNLCSRTSSSSYTFLQCTMYCLVQTFERRDCLWSWKHVYAISRWSTYRASCIETRFTSDPR